MTTASINLLWWISVFELPAMAGLFIMILKNHQAIEKRISKMKEITEEAYLSVKESLAVYKLEVAKTYASLNYLNAVEKRLTEHLLRIENKLSK